MKSIALLFAFILIPLVTMSQTQPNYDENKVPALHLPDPFVSEKGKQIRSIEDWEKVRRPEIFSQFESEVYGQLPKDFDAISLRWSRKKRTLFRKWQT